MAILSVQANEQGQSGIVPAIKRIETNNTVAEITAAGYLNDAVKKGIISLSETDIVLVTTSTVSGAAPSETGWYEVSYSAGNWSLVAPAAPGSVTLPTIADHIAVYTGTTGTLSDDATTAINGGNIQAGLSGTAGTLASFPSTAAKGSLKLVAADNTGDTAVTITNAAHGQASVYSIPDAGAATGNVLVKGTAFVDGNTIIASGTDGVMVDSGVSLQNTLLYVAVPMSAAEFAGAYAAPHLLVAAAGADTLLVLESAQVLMTYGTTQYANGGVAHIQYDSTANGAGVIASSTQAAANFADAASTALGFNQGVVKQPFTTAVNKGLYFSNVTGAFDTGDSDFVVHVWYRIIPTV